MTSTKDYTKEINRVIDYMYTHIDRPLSVTELCEQVNLSPYHFQRIFTHTIGESLAKYVVRTRLERAASLLLSDSKAPIMNIAYECGFNSVSVFCRNFKRHFGMSAETYRHTIEQNNSTNGQSKSKIETGSCIYSHYFCARKTIKIGDKTMNCTFEIKQMPALSIVYCRHLGAFDQMQEAFKKLMQWAYPRGLVNAPGAQLLSVYHNDPNITEKGKLTSDAALTIHEKVKTDGDIGQYDIAAGLYAVGRFELAMDEFTQAWNSMFDLLKEHGCQCTNAYHYELYLNNRDEHPENKFIVDICIPVKRV